MNCYQCGYPQTGFENAVFWTLPFPSEMDGSDVQVIDMIGASLSQYTPRIKKNTFFCDRCWAQTTYSKMVFFYRTPKILLLHLDRYRVENDQSANSLEPVSFPSEDDVLDIAEYSAATHMDETTYYLYGLIESSGLVT